VAVGSRKVCALPTSNRLAFLNNFPRFLLCHILPPHLTGPKTFLARLSFHRLCCGVRCAGAYGYNLPALSFSLEIHSRM